MFDQATDELYAYACERARWSALLSVLTGHSCRLLALNEVSATCTVRAQYDAGMHVVPIDQIRGSKDRCADFDRDFNPLQEHGRERWLCIARARKRGKALPPVELVQIGEIYFVRDGHHRISVARALGQRTIKARVVVRQVSGRLPWEMEGQTGPRGLWMAIKMRLSASL